MERDISIKNFHAACKRHGFKPQHILGYYDIGQGACVSILNAGSRRRDQLAYLIREAKKVAGNKV